MSEDRSFEVLREIARTATDLGPALAPAGHEELLRSITAAAKDIFEAAACSLALLDDAQEELTFYVASGAGAEDVIGMRVPVGQGIAGWVVASGQPIEIADVTRDPRFARDVAESTGYVPRAILAMPLETERAMLGVIEVLDRRAGGGSGTHDMELLALFAHQAALAIENSRVFSDLGRALFDAVAETADGDLGPALERVAREGSGPNPQLAELAAHFNFLGRMGPEERHAATRLVGELVAYMRARARPG
ncbi:MAG: GAF domain-containing protein [Actinomycetota bacterium]|nr:GAF domain-containing protein [Actinomycetota bacterium]